LIRVRVYEEAHRYPCPPERLHRLFYPLQIADDIEPPFGGQLLPLLGNQGRYIGLDLAGDLEPLLCRVVRAIDAADEIAEGNENNNAAALAGTLEVTPPPDLRANLLNFAPLVVNQGDPIALAGYIVNGGGTATNSSFWVEFYVSPNTDFSPPRHMLCDSAHVPPLDARKSFPLHSLARTVSGSVPDGEYTLGIKIDALNEVSESDETNNLAWVSRRRLYIGVQPTRARCWHLYR